MAVTLRRGDWCPAWPTLHREQKCSCWKMAAELDVLQDYRAKYQDVASQRAGYHGPGQDEPDEPLAGA